MTIYAFDPGRVNNAQLIRDCHQLGYLNDDDVVLDPTYGKGRFWGLWRPARLVASDIKGNGLAVNCVDFTNMVAYFDNKFDAVVFDPPYKLGGTSAHPSDGDYGVADDWNGTKDRMSDIYKGIAECLRVLKPSGILLMKCQDQVCSGDVVWQERDFTSQVIGWPDEPAAKLIDKLFVHGGIPQPAGRRQVHARRNYSTALIFRKGK